MVSAALLVLVGASVVGVGGIVVIVGVEEVFVEVVWAGSEVRVLGAAAAGVTGFVADLLADAIIASQSICSGSGVVGVGVGGSGVGGLGTGLLLGWCLCPWCRS